MALWGVLFLLGIAGISVSADPNGFDFPEVARDRVSSRIVSGWDAEPGQFPYILSLRMVSATGTVSACGGTIIHEQWGLTAAHCTATRISFVLRAGAVTLPRPEILLETNEFYNHPLYNDNLPSVVQPNDISILKFPISLTFSQNVQPIRLQSSADQNRNYNGERLTAAGWGRTWTDGVSPEHLQWVYLRGITNWACFLAYSGSSIIQDSTICASSYNVTSQSTCQGDSGGPLTVIEADGQVTQVGISSFVSSTGCHTDFPAGFCRTGPYHDWYLEKTGINFDSNVSEEDSSSSEEDSSSSEENSSSSEEDSSSSEEEASTTVAPESSEEEATTTVAPESSEEEATTTVAPESSEEVAPTTVTPESSEKDSDSSEEDSDSSEEEATTTVAPESSEEDENDSSNSADTSESDEDDDENNFFFGKLMRRFF